MIEVNEAKRLITENIKTLPEKTVYVKDSLGYVLAEDIFSPQDIPPFSSSAVDGYAIRDIEEIEEFVKVTGEIKAGEKSRFSLKKGEAVKVFTGSAIPKNTKAIVMKEFTKEENGYIKITKRVEAGENIRFKGEEVKKGEKVLEKGTVITPGVIGFLSIMGINKVKVIRKPRISVLITGSEIIQPGKRLEEGKVYDANSYIVSSFLKSFMIPHKIFRAKDDIKKIKEIFKKNPADVFIFTGGISAGDYDFVRELMKDKKIKNIFYKVSQKPGKPMFFGKKGEMIIFGLPGNPAAVFTLMIEYVIPAIKYIMGYKDIFPKEIEVPLKNEITKKSDRTYFLRGYFDGEGVYVLPHQESHMLSSAAKANAIIIAEKEKTKYEKGEKVKIHLI